MAFSDLQIVAKVTIMVSVCCNCFKQRHVGDESGQVHLLLAGDLSVESFA